MVRLKFITLVIRRVNSLGLWQKLTSSCTNVTWDERVTFTETSPRNLLDKLNLPFPF